MVARYSTEREFGEAFGTWLERVGGATAVAQGLADLDVFPTPEENEDFYVDFGETGPYEAEVGDSECAV